MLQDPSLRYKMTVANQINYLDRKIKANQAQYDMDRKAAKRSALSSGDLDKYEHFTGEELNDRPSALEQIRFEVSRLGRIYNKGLSKVYHKDGIWKRLNNIEYKNEEQLKMIENKNRKQSINN